MKNIELTPRTQISLLMFIAVYFVGLIYQFAPLVKVDIFIAGTIYQWTVRILFIFSAILGFSEIKKSLFPLFWSIPAIFIVGWDIWPSAT